MSVSRCVSCKGHMFSHACQVKTQQCLLGVTTGKWVTPGGTVMASGLIKISDIKTSASPSISTLLCWGKRSLH